ncbi:class I SAM-dependent methyltransferase [Patescibacteria group bacterium]
MKEAWNQIARVYDKLLPPNRPGKIDIEIYGKLIKPKLKKGVNILLLGSTPELRDLLYSSCLAYDANLTAIDISEDMYQAMSLLMEKTNPKEKFVNRPWQSTGLESNSYDLIIGDEVIVNIPLSDRDIFFKEIVRLLKKDGSFITRHNSVIPENKKLNNKKIKEQFQKVVDLEQTIGNALNNISSLYTYYLSSLHPSQNVSIADMIDQIPHFQKIISNDPKMKTIGDEIAERAKIFEASKDQTWVYKDKKFNEFELKKYFRIDTALQPAGYIKAKNNILYSLSPLENE